ncbi:hypothetical protein SAMN05216436_102278 [bacterium A37T11]|nr:hypothetical protein SAMN05216436_102278 [bacterium A37T11]
MKKRTFFTLCTCALFALIITLGLYFWRGKNPYHQFKGFRREIRHHTLPPIKPELKKLPIPTIYRERIGPASFLVVSRVKGKNMLGKFVLPDRVYFVSGLLRGQQDDFFTTLGSLLVDPMHNKVVYVYLYRNEFMVLDTGLNLQYRARTIDTISQAKIKTAVLDKNTLTLASPPLMVNEQGVLQWPYLYIHSCILAANEDPDVFDRHRVIDVYDLNDRGRYCFSFYLNKR